MMNDITRAAPELFLLLAGSSLLVVSGYWKRQQQLTAVGAVLALTMGAALAWMLPPSTEAIFANSFVHDTMAAVLKTVMLLSAAAAFIYSERHLRVHDRNRREHYVLGIFATLGGCLMVSAQNMLVMYTGLELLSLSLISMVAVHKGHHIRLEAAMKYFTLSAMASGVLLYGMSMLYGASGSLQFSQIADAIQQSPDSGIVVLGLVFTMAGIAFKIGAAPFHAWVPDVYEGAPTPVTLFVGSAPKIAAFGMAARMLTEALPHLQHMWVPMLAVLAGLSIVLGNLAAIMQKDIRRMLGYSTIAHMGFMLLGMMSASAQGFAVAMFYAVAYLVMSTGALGIITMLGSGGREMGDIKDFRGLASRHPVAALCMLALLFSMAGIPPFVGFWAKWMVLAEALQAGYVKLAVLAVAASVAGAFYYLRIIRMMYFEQAPQELEGQQRPATPIALAVAAVNAAAVLALGVVPESILHLCVASF